MSSYLDSTPGPASCRHSTLYQRGEEEDSTLVLVVYQHIGSILYSLQGRVQIQLDHLYPQDIQLYCWMTEELVWPNLLLEEEEEGCLTFCSGLLVLLKLDIAN